MNDEKRWRIGEWNRRNERKKDRILGWRSWGKNDRKNYRKEWSKDLRCRNNKCKFIDGERDNVEKGGWGDRRI